MGTNEKPQMAKVNFKLQINKVMELEEFICLINIWTIS
jgi:hypothetical protein